MVQSLAWSEGIHVWIAICVKKKIVLAATQWARDIV